MRVSLLGQLQRLWQLAKIMTTACWVPIIQEVDVNLAVFLGKLEMHIVNISCKNAHRKYRSRGFRCYPMRILRELKGFGLWRVSGKEEWPDGGGLALDMLTRSRMCSQPSANDCSPSEQASEREEQTGHPMADKWLDLQLLVLGWRLFKITGCESINVTWSAHLTREVLCLETGAMEVAGGVTHLSQLDTAGTDSFLELRESQKEVT